MPLIQRPWTINSYTLSKVWFKCSSVDLRIQDSSSISSKIKTWLYADQLERPEDMINYQPVHLGGLGRLRPEPDNLAGAGTGIPVPVCRNRMWIFKFRFRYERTGFIMSKFRFRFKEPELGHSNSGINRI